MSNQESPLSSKSVMSAFGLAWELGYTIALPLVILAGGGRLLDRYLNTSPLFLLIGVAISVVVTVYVLYIKIKEILNQNDQDNTTDNNKINSR